ncbi:NAD(P)H-binding protein [Amycolatopsis sp. NPDC051071]|uniref:SDR family oxidoreductase n=1 Tax=Amycolatopsis sp. NPDC051071 TaxID=3154637 RepID=UPI00341B7290
MVGFGGAFEVSTAQVSAGRTAGVRYRQADLAKPDGLRSVFDGADRLFLLMSGDFLAAGGDVADVVSAARDAGVRRIVLLSSQGVGSGRHAPAFEEAVKASSPEWTVLRPGGFASNAFQWAPATTGSPTS